ncbi:unnamed protein product [Kuraishia capsulata CBS 1993]|uniref:Fe2OG dioxygenase domain-containing protein n=1 Tax=Kuraishia capsulata CBS 1993 TaxID=1382522 RepID=W6MUR9_9ASCO|nr:uncharacterized protein KUCA_T00001836001 [Kuraishia capsulata CBS 1993]CDK25865.1 unnamed protein product [Kuraishia capsulata CBS 1993]
MAVGETAGVVPIIDFSPYYSKDSTHRKAVGDEIFNAMKTVGFVYLKNHGIPKGLQEECFAWSKRFFALPMEEKMKCPHPPNGWHHRGYSGIGKEKVSQMEFDEEILKEIRKVPDVKESFDMGAEFEDYWNIWPDEKAIPGFREFLCRYHNENHEVAMRVLRAIALGMGLDESFFDAYHTEKNNQVRLLHYPATDDKALRNMDAFRIGAHSDFGTMTMVMQDECGGLEVEDPHVPGLFHPAPYIEDTLVINIGDFLMRWSNDVLKSTLHRVRGPTLESSDGVSQPRYSIPYFIVTNWDCEIDALPGSWSEENPKRYEPITTRDYIFKRLNATY